MECFGRHGKEKAQYCAIKLLDESEISFNIQKDTKGHVLLERVYRHLNLVETDYFGLRYLDSYSQTHWLDATKAVSKQIKNGPPFTLYFGVKFYTEDPCKLREEVTRYQFFLQIKMDMLQGRLPCTFAVAAELCAYAVQSEMGDYDAAQHSSGYISEFRFVPNQTEDLESQVSDIHKSLRGQTPTVAELNFLERAKWLDMYGVDLHPVVGEDNVEYLLGLTPSGVVVYRNKSKVAQYFWPRISKIHFKETDFTLKVRGKDGLESEYVFQLESKPACKHLWKCCIEQHAFFRLPQAMEGGVLGRSSSLSSKQYRHSGRTQREAMEASTDLERPQPRVSRTPSRRYQRRASFSGESPHHTRDTSGIMGNEVAVSFSPDSHSRAETPVNRHTNGRDSPTSGISTRSVPWENGDGHTGVAQKPPKSILKSESAYDRRGLFTPAGTTPVSAYSSGQKRRSKSRGPSPGPRRYYSDWSGSESEVVHSWKKHNRRAMSEGGSDHESSHRRHHHHKHRRRRSRGGQTSGSESEHQYNEGRRRRHHRSSEHMIESESQWAAVQSGMREHGEMRQAGDSAVKKLPRDIYTNGSVSSRHERHRSRDRDYDEHHRWLKDKRKSQDPEFVQELRRHIQPELVDPTQYTEDELRDIPYTNVDVPVHVGNQKKPNLHRVHDEHGDSHSEHSGRHSISRTTPTSRKRRPHSKQANYQSDASQGSRHPQYSEGEESTHSSRQKRRDRTLDNTTNQLSPTDASPYTAYLRGDMQAFRKPNVVRQDAVSSHNGDTRYSVNANNANSNSRYRERKGSSQDSQQDAQLHDGMMDMRLHSREDSGIDDHDESVHDRISPVTQQNGSSQDRSLSRHRPDANHYNSNNYTPDPVPQQYKASQQQSTFNHGTHHAAVDQGFRADSQSSVGPESAYCGSETHDPPLPIPHRIQMGTNGRNPAKDHRRTPVNVPTPNRNLRIDYHQPNGQVHGTPQRNHHRGTSPSEHNYTNGSMQSHHEHESRSESNHWPGLQPTRYQVQNGNGNGAIEERPRAVEQKPTDVGDETGEDEVGQLQQYPQKGQRTGNRPMLGKRYSITTSEIMRVSQSEGDNKELLTEL
ncbi:band 4.1-like protein 4 isoform X2 [Amphiura filiformis]|uniref:band 4.1-like protein 4 isoform X2 n=1 Tax=Amphiura filiformis TaxID=82378 RepID=UPI003B2267DB